VDGDCFSENGKEQSGWSSGIKRRRRVDTTVTPENEKRRRKGRTSETRGKNEKRRRKESRLGTWREVNRGRSCQGSEGSGVVCEVATRM
jgi:hypothetical protein